MTKKIFIVVILLSGLTILSRNTKALFSDQDKIVNNTVSTASSFENNTEPPVEIDLPQDLNQNNFFQILEDTAPETPQEEMPISYPVEQ